MLMATAAAYMHADSSHSSASSTISPPPWHLAAVPVATHHQQQHHQAVLFDRDLAAPSPSSPAPRPRNNHHNHQHQQLRAGAARRPSRTSRRRQPRPSRKMPTTYITADPASFRRMVHQVTGADDLPPPPPLAPTPLCRPAPTRVLAAAAGALPTLDTSALLLRNSGSESARWTTGPLVASEVEVDLGAGTGGGVDVGLGEAGYGGGFPTLESWDALLY